MDSSTDLRTALDLAHPLRQPDMAAPPSELEAGARLRQPDMPEALLQPGPDESLLRLQAPGPLLQADEADAVYREIIRTTHQCVLYGSGGFAVLCILIGAVEALFGR